MNDFTRSNKITGIHWLKTSIKNIQIKIRLKIEDGILTLPKFEEYANDSHSINLQNLDNPVEEHTFQWQEKVFSMWEIQRYSEIHNCINDTELSYHDTIKDLDDSPKKVFTYIHEDYHMPLPSDKKIKEKFKVQNLSSWFERLNVRDKVGKLFQESSSISHLFKSEENIAEAEEQWMAMHVMFDNSEYNEDSQLLLKQEATLLSIYHNLSHNYVILSPDVTHLEVNPYNVEIAEVRCCGYKYSVEIDFSNEENGEDLDILLRKLYKTWMKRQKHLLNFVMPSIGRKIYFLTLEIVSATDFEMDDLYVEFNIKIPETVLCSDPLHGRTHISRALTREKSKEWCFGHLVELSLETVTGQDPPIIRIFFEAISKDWWGRHRTEGYAYLPLPLTPGRSSKQLSCSRPEELDPVEADSRRFFLGGCHLIKDLEILANPQLHDTKFKFVSTGTLNLQCNLISQSHIGTNMLPAIPSTSTASALLLGAEAALRKYKKARAKLAAAAKEIVEVDGSGDG